MSEPKTLGSGPVNDDLYEDTIEQLLEHWDAGRNIFTIELGGLGPGYEQAIQLAAVEFARACKDLPGIKLDDRESTEQFRAKCDEVLHKINKDLGGLSGAQYDAACWLAFNWCFNGGPKALVERCRAKGQDDRIIQCGNFFPKVIGIGC